MKSRTKRLRMWGVLGLFLALTVGEATGLARPIETNIEVMPAFPTTLDEVVIRVSGQWSDSCIPRFPMVFVIGNMITISTSHPGEFCLAVITPYSFEVPLGRLRAGTYWVNVTYRGPKYRGPVGSVVFTVREVAPLITAICDPTGPYTFLEDGARYRATGGANPAPGADSWFNLVDIEPNFLNKWRAAGKTTTPFGIELGDNGDWVIYRGITLPLAWRLPPEVMELCLNTTATTAVTVEVFVSDDFLTIPPYNADIQNTAGWSRLGTVTVVPGGYRIYTITIPWGTPGLDGDSYNFALRLTAGNVQIAWFRLR